MTSLDPVTLELIKGAVQSARAEMEALVERTAMSPFIREKKDYFTAFFDGAGRLAASSHLPIAAGNLVEAVLRHYPPGAMAPGDVYAYNDAYGSGGAISHMPDMVFIAPVFHGGAIVGYAEAWGHLWDIGGMHPGSISPDATDIFQEGVVIPPVRIATAAGPNEELLRLLRRNTRYPEMVAGDITALMACVRLGARRLEDIAARFGAPTLAAAFDYMLDQSEAALRAALGRTLPDGRHAFRDWIDSDAVTDRSYSVNVALDKRGDRVALDFRDSDDQARGAINFLMDSSVPKFMTGLALTLDDPAIGMNAGFARAINEVHVRPGSIVSPAPPAPIGMRSHAMTRVNSALFGALARATGGHGPAASAVYVLYYLRSRTLGQAEIDLCIEGLAVGFGARPHADGLDAVYYVAQKNYPVEFAEMEFGVRIEGYGLHCDSGGPGLHRGGCGIFRDVRVIADEATFGIRMDNVRYPAWGVAGGMAGRPGHVLLNPGTPEERRLKPMSDGSVLKRGDLVRIVTAGGGGWGSPLERPALQVCTDVQDGYISEVSAREDYGVVLTRDGSSVDDDATARLRERLPRPAGLFHRHGYFDDEEPPRAAD